MGGVCWGVVGGTESDALNFLLEKSFGNTKIPMLSYCHEIIVIISVLRYNYGRFFVRHYRKKKGGAGA